MFMVSWDVRDRETERDDEGDREDDEDERVNVHEEDKVDESWSSDTIMESFSLTSQQTRHEAACSFV